MKIVMSEYLGDCIRISEMRTLLDRFVSEGASENDIVSFSTTGTDSRLSRDTAAIYFVVARHVQVDTPQDSV